tara:strand:+ start:210 stop:443 length:234 start_codon:yes stop_codon:yes gene_type:complete
MIKKVLVTLLVDVDTEDDLVTPDNDPLTQNVVLNHIDNDVYMYPVEEIHTSYSCDYEEHLENTKKRILEKLRYGTLL